MKEKARRESHQWRGRSLSLAENQPTGGGTLWKYAQVYAGRRSIEHLVTAKKSTEYITQSEDFGRNNRSLAIVK